MDKRYRKYQSWYIADLPRYGASVRLRVTFVEPMPVVGHKGWIMLASLGDEPQFLAVHPKKGVAMWEHEDGKMHPVADSLDDLFARLAKSKTTKTPREEHYAELERAAALVKKDRFKDALKILKALDAPVKSTDKMAALDDEGAEQNRHNLLGLCYEDAKKFADATEHFERGGREGTFNLARMAIEHGGDLKRIAKLLDNVACIDDDVVFHILDYRGQIGVLLGDRALIDKAYKQLHKNWADDEPKRVKRARKNLEAIVKREKKPGLVAEILDWFKVVERVVDADAAKKNRAWWKALPKHGTFWQPAFRERVKMKREPTDQDLARLVDIDWLYLTGYEVYDVEPIRMLTKLDTLVFAGEVETLEPLRGASRLKEVEYNRKKLKRPFTIEPGRSAADRELFAACEAKSAGRVKKAIAAGAKLQCFNKYGQTPLHVALIYGSLKCALLLVEAGADLHAKQNQPPHTPVLDFCDEKKRAQLQAAAARR